MQQLLKFIIIIIIIIIMWNILSTIGVSFK